MWNNIDQHRIGATCVWTLTHTYPQTATNCVWVQITIINNHLIWKLMIAQRFISGISCIRSALVNWRSNWTSCASSAFTWLHFPGMFFAFSRRRLCAAVGSIDYCNYFYLFIACKQIANFQNDFLPLCDGQIRSAARRSCLIWNRLQWMDRQGARQYLCNHTTYPHPDK